MELQFLGAAGTVTGSKFLLTSAGSRLLVDCGLFQGVKKIRQRNWQPFPIDPSQIDAIVLTHAHTDHTGYLPALVRDGFDGPIFTTEATRELAGILLPDSGRIQEEDAKYANRKGFSKHHPALPLYTERDAKAALELLEPMAFGQSFETLGLRVRFEPAGHILGAAGACVSRGGTTIRFSGDLGRSSDLLMYPPESLGRADWVVMESTYGDREHPETDPILELKDHVARTAARRGVMIVPSFAVGRAQAMLYSLYRIFSDHDVPEIPVYLDSPMATSVTSLYRRYSALHRLSEETTRKALGLPTFIRSVNESKKLSRSNGPAIIVSASGMATAGRVLHHLKAFAPDSRNSIVLPSYQAPGTRGAALAAGAEEVTIHGRPVPVRAEVTQLDLFSAHAGQGELVDWVGSAASAPRQVFLVHGEPVPADTLRRKIESAHGLDVFIPDHRESVELV